MVPRPDAVVIGAGLAGLVAARKLAGDGADVVLLDKGRSPGGRLATRRLTVGDDIARVDHGAQFMTVRSQTFRDLVAGWPVHVWHHGPTTAGSVTDDPSSALPSVDGHPRYVGDRGMTGIARHLAQDLEVRLGTHATTIRATADGWHVGVRDGDPVVARRLLVTCPVPQTLALLDDQVPAPPAVQGLAYDPCVGLLAVLDRPPPHAMVQFDAGPVHVISDNASKGISDLPAVTVHATAAASAAWLDQPDTTITGDLARLVLPWLGGAAVRTAQVKRWRYAQPQDPHPDRALALAEGLVLAGDAFGGPKIEGAALSGLAAADLLAGVV
jgi:predicted NAD/FAD-dependent oxidoreductase